MLLYNLTIKELHQGLVKKQFSVKELLTAALQRVINFDKKILAFITLSEDLFAKAERMDKIIARNEPLNLLSGIPYSAKDVFSTNNLKTTACSRILANYMPPYTATTIEKLNQEGAILIGKTNNDAFGFGSSTENSDYQVTHNPWNLSKVPGGSSGGSAAAVASGMGTFSIAEDTGGSIRQPACYCGITGIKVTYGRVSRYGVLAYGSSLDTIGVLGKSVEDAAILLEVIAGKDPLDGTTLTAPVPKYLKNINCGIKDKIIGIPKEYFSSGLDKEVDQSIKTAINKFIELGAKIEEVSLPYTKHAIPAYYLSGISEVSANLARYDGIRFGYSDKKAKTIDEVYLNSRAVGFGEEVKRRIMLGTYALSSGYYDAYYNKAQKIRTLIKRDFENVFKKVDLLIAPVSPFPAFDIGEKTGDPLTMWLADIYTVTINPAGIPSLALPCGFTKDNLPIGLQLIGPQLSEESLFQAGYAYQKMTDWHLRRPDIK